MLLSVSACGYPVNGVIHIGGADLRVYPSISIKAHDGAATR
ncbi:hypothetical protein [Paragemmobacter straminiformis]|nr:hypothetical protein [Gemmobacter straminiformis]